MSSPPLKQSPLVAGSPPGTKSPLASSPPGTKSPLASSPPGTKSPLASSPPGTKSPLASEAGSPTGTKSPGSPPGPKSIPKSPEEMRLKKETRLARLQRQASKDSQGPRLKSVGSGGSLFRPRMDSTSSACRRPSLGFGHSNSIPFHLDASSLHDIDLEEVPWWTSKRLLLSFTCFVGFFFLYSLRVNLSTAIVCMTKEIVDPKIVNGSIVYDINNSTNSTNTTLTVTESKLTGYDDEGCPIMSGGRKLEGEFEWSKGLQGLVLGAFFWGYTLMQIPSGFLSDRFGARLTIACGMFPVALLTIISPFLARGSPYLLLVGRALIGMGEAMMYPGMQSLWSKWSPPHERSRLVGFAFGGSQLGNALTFPFAGLLCAYGFDGGWPSVFYVTVPWWTSKRLLLSFTCFVGFFFLYSLRVNLSTAIVCMTKEIVDPKIVNGSIVYDINNSTNSTNTTLTVTESKLTGYDDEGCPIMSGGRKLEGEFEWSKGLQGLVLGAFFWGYTLMQIPSGFLSDRFGARLTIACGMFPVALLTIISPFLARGSPYLLLVGRALIGMGEAMMYPGMQSLWSKWSPPHERSRLVGFAFGGSQLGNALTFPFAGLLCAYGFDGGWPSVFYVTGMLAFIWCVAYVLYTRDSPGQMNSITAIERKYIEQSLGTYGQSVEERLAQRKKEKPWKKIFTSGPVWAILIANACGNYGAYMLLTQMPTYMKEVLKFDIKSNGAFSMIPYLAFWLFIILGGQIADVIISKEILSTTVTRKVCCCLGTVVPAIFLVATGFMDCMNQVGAVVLLSLSMAFCGFQFSSFFINHGDIAPKYAGTVFGFTNTGASIPGILAPYVVGAITKNKTKEEWRLAFYIAAAIYVFGAVMYCILAKGEVLDWAKEEVEHDIREDFPLHEITEENDEEENEKDKMINGEKAGVVFE